ncbi:MAG: LamG domain-containing protein [Bacteroidetes bacterium]|nr:LamG domain-containing protein [Bacteroidota bacterium]
MISNTWIHLVGTYDGLWIPIYVNSLLAQQVSYPGNFSTGSVPLILGKVSTTFLDGRIDDLFIYQRALSQEDVTQLYNR